MSELEPTYLDRVFNSTISWPQQFLWRVIRAIEDDRIDLFSEKGLADPAMLPLLGVFSSHKNDVMPDYMAEQMGFADKGDSGFWSQLGAAIISDPLTYLTGGLSALGKVGKSASLAGKLPALSGVLRKTAAAKGVTLDELAKAMPLTELTEHMDSAIAQLAGAVGAQEVKQLGTLTKLRDKLLQDIPAAQQLADARAAKAGKGTAQLTLSDAVHGMRDRRAALGIPGLTNLGLKVNVPADYQNWYQLFKAGANTGGTQLAKSTLLKGMVNLPGVGTALSNVTAVPRHLVGGWRVGREARVGLRSAEGLSKKQFKSLMSWLSPDGAAPVALNVNERIEELGDVTGLVEQLQDGYVRGIEANLSAEDAFKAAFNNSGIGRRDETGKQLYNRLLGRTINSPVAFPTWGKGAAEGKRRIPEIVETLLERHTQASELNQRGISSWVPESSEAKLLEDAFTADRAKLNTATAFLAEKSFETARSFKAATNKIFHSGQATRAGEDAYNTFLAHAARDNDQLESMTQALYAQIKRVTEVSDLSFNDVSKLISNIVQMDAMPGEIAAAFNAAKLEPERFLGQSIKSVSNFLTRQRNGLRTFEKLLKKGGLDSAGARETILDAFETTLFPFLEREGAAAGEAQQRIVGIYERLISNTIEHVDEFTPLQRKRLQRVNNKHVVAGWEPVPVTSRQALKSHGFGFDPGPSTAWRERERARAITEGVNGAVTGEGTVSVSVNELLDLPGEMGEHLRMSSPESTTKIGELAESIKTEGYRKTEGPLVWVKADGSVVVAEGNHRIRAAKEAGVEALPVQVRYFAGSEELPGRFNIDRLATELGMPRAKRPVLSRYAGRHAGTLTHDELADALAELEAAGQVPLHQDEVIRLAEEMPALRQFARRNKLSTEEAIALVGRKGTAQQRRVMRQEVVAEELWDAQRTRWSGTQAADHAERYGFRLVRDEETNALRFESAKLAESTLRRSYNGRLANNYASYSEAMSDLRTWLEANGKYVERHGPGMRETQRTLLIGQEEIDDLVELLDDGELDILRGRAKEFDADSLDSMLQEDYRRLSELRRRRALPKEHTLYDEPIIPRRVAKTTAVDTPRTSDELALFLEREGEVINLETLPQTAVDYARGRFLVREVMNALKRAHKAGIAPKIDPRILVELEDHTYATGQAIRDMIANNLPQEFRDVLTSVDALSHASFDAARRAGVWMPGSPLAYLPRFFNKAGKARIAKLMGEIELADSSILARLGVKQAQYFKRRWDKMTVADLNELNFALREAMVRKGASPKLREFHAELDSLMEEAGIGISGLGKNLPWSKAERLESDPFLGLLQRFGVAQQDASLSGYFDNMLASSTGKNGESYMVAGRVVGIVDDTGNVQRLNVTDSTVRSKARNVADEVEVVTLEGTVQQEKYVPKALLIEMEDGTVRTIENNLFKETGFGLLGLGQAVDTTQLGYKTSIGNTFARATLRSDLHNQLVKAPLNDLQAAEMLGQHVVLGNEHNIVGLVKTAAQVHQVTPAALRTFDAINYGIKSFQTIFRLPFHIANLSSGVFQAHMAGASSKNLAAAYVDTFRFLFGDQSFARGATRVSDLMDTEADVVSLGITRLLRGDRTRLQEIARLHGGGQFSSFLERNGSSTAVQELDAVEDLVIRLSDGREIDVREFIQTAGEMQLYGTFASSLSRGSRTIADNLMRIKMHTLEPSLGNQLRDVPKRLMQRMSNVSETSEVINRTATALALVRDGHPIRRAIEITKEAHVPYEKLTWTERNVMKRLSVYYTFPRHYMPWAWARFADDPTKLSAISHFLRDQNIVSTQEGRPTGVLGNYRVDLGRLNANLEAAGLLAAFADRVMMPAAEAVLPGVDPYDTRKLRSAYSTSGLTTIGGVAGLMFGGDILPDPGRDMPNKSPWEEATQIVWPFKMLSQLMGKQPKTGAVAAVTGENESSPYVEYTPLESWLSDSVFGLGVRKVRDNHELVRTQLAYRSMLKRIQMRAAATSDAGKRKRLLENATELGYALRGALSEAQQKVFK
jgi:ParB-like chromosome segregation protein Spo0J